MDNGANDGGANFFLVLTCALAALIALKIGFVGMAALCDLTWPRASQRTLDIYRARPFRCFWVGSVNAILGPLVALLLISTKVLAPFGLLLMLGLISLVVAGYGIGYHEIGLRLASSEREEHGPKTILQGGLLAEAAFLAPVLGQAFSLYILFRGLGAAIITLMTWRRVKGGPAQENPPETI